MKTYAYVRRDLIEEETFPPASISLTADQWTSLLFEIVECEDCLDDDEGYNMRLIHPGSGEKFLVYSIDFDFTN